jgi:hypothetical protein
MSWSQNESKEKLDLTISVDGSEYHPLNSIAGKDQLLEMARLDAREHDVFFLEE